MTFSNKFISNSPFRKEKDPKTTDTLNPNYYKPRFNKPQTALSIEQVKKDSEKYKSKKDKDGKFLKKEIPITEEQNLAEFNREIKEFECVNGVLKLKQTDND